MFERDLHNERTNDAVVTIRTPNQDEGGRQENFRSQITRDGGNTSLEIEIPRLGISSTDRWHIYITMIIASPFLLLGIPLGTLHIGTSGVYGLWLLLFVAVPLLIICVVLNSTKIEHFTHTTITITSNTYCLITRNITWRSFFQIICNPSYFNDLENGEAEEADPIEMSHPRIPSLEAKVEAHHNEDSVSYDIKLGSVSFARGLDNSELEWLTEEINRFLRETR
eukprot:g9171.t1